MLITYNKENQPKKIYEYGNTTDQPISMKYRSDQEGEGQGQWKTAYYLYDGQGNVRQLTNERGQVIANYNYLPFGEMMNKGMRGQGIEGNEGIGMIWGRENGLRNTITYQGREYDRDSGLYYYRARYESSTLGRFLEVDPLLREVPGYTLTASATAGSSSGGCATCGGGASSGGSTSYSSYMSPEIPYIFPEMLTPSAPDMALNYPYAFEQNNPIMYRDPTGESIWVYWRKITVNITFHGRTYSIPTPFYHTGIEITNEVHSYTFAGGFAPTGNYFFSPGQIKPLNSLYIHIPLLISSCNKYDKDLYNEIQNSESHLPNYDIFTYNCYSWRNDMLLEIPIDPGVEYKLQQYDNELNGPFFDWIKNHFHF